MSSLVSANGWTADQCHARVPDHTTQRTATVDTHPGHNRGKPGTAREE